MPDQPPLAAARPVTMMEIAARGLPQKLLLDIDTCRELHTSLGDAIASIDEANKETS